MADQIDKLAMKKAAAVEDSLANKVTGNQGIFETKDLNPLPSTPTRDALIPKFESTTYQPPEQIIPATLGQATVAGAASMAGELIKGANIVRELPTINPVSTMRAAWGMLGDLAKAAGADQVGEALLTGSTFLKGNSKPSYVSEQINSFADALSSVNDEFAPTPEMARLALQTDAVMQQLAQGSRTKAGVATELALNALSDPSTIANAMSSLIPSIIATLGPGKFVTPLLAAVGRGEQGVTDLEATIAQKYITDTILTSGIPVEDALALRTAAAFSKDGEQLLIVATLAQMMNAEAGIDMAYPVATEREKIESRVYGTLSAMADYGSGHIFNKLNPLSKAAKLRRAMAKAELEGLPLPVAPTQLTVPALLKPAVTAPLEVPSEMGAEYFEQLAKQRGSFAERDAKVNMADVAVAGQLGFAGGFGASAAAVPFTSGTIKKGAAAVVEAAASVAAPIVTKVSDLLSPTAETSSSIAAANAVPAGAVDRSVMTVKGEAVDEAYNPILAMQGILDRGAEYAKDVQAGEVSELLGATFNASTEHLRNALLYVEEVRKSADISQETKDAIFKGVDQLYERHALVTGQMSQKATEMLLDNDLVLTPEDTASARDIVLGSLDIGAQSLEELRALADSPTFASDTAAQSSIGAAIDIATAEDSLRSNLKDTESVKNEFLNGNPDKAGHFGVREYLQRAAAAAQASDVKTLKATAERMERWLKSTEKNKAFIPAVVAQRELELGFLSKAIERVRAMEAEVAGRPAAEAKVAAAPSTTTDSPAPTATDGVLPAAPTSGPLADPVGSTPTSKVTPSGATPTSVAQAKLDAKAAKDAVAKDASEADKYKAYISSMKRALKTQVKDSEAAKDIQGIIDRAEDYVSKLSPTPATPVTQAAASKAAKDAYRKSGTDLEKQGAFIKSLEESLATHSDTSKGEGKAIKDLLSAAKQRMVDATTPLAPTVVDDAPSAFDDTGVNYDDDSGDGDQGFIPLAQENGVTDSTEQAAPLGLEEALAAGVLTDVGTVTPTRKGSNEAAPSELLRGKTLLDLIMKPTAEGDRSKGLFRYIVSKGRVIVNNLMLTDAQIFVRAVIAKAKASDPKITQEQLQQLNLAANQLHKQLKADSSLGMLDGLGNTIRPNTNDGVYANKADPLRFLYVVGADGKLALPDTIRAAIQISALNWADSLGRQNTSRDMEGVAQGLFGLGEFDTLPASLFNKYTNIGTNRAVAATAIGKNISKAIGIKFDPTKVPVGFTDNFNTALGLAAIGYLTHKGVVVQPQQSVIPAAEWAADYLEATGTDISGKGLEDITFVQLDLTDAKPSEAVEAAVAAIHQAPSIVDILLSNEAGQVLATSEPSTKVNERTRRNSEVTKRMQDALVKYQGTPNLTNQSLKAILKQPDAQGIIEEVMGLNEFNPNAHHASKREAAKAAVENQKREIARLLGAYARNPEFLDSPIYLKSEFSFQLRNMMTGSDINTQSFKSHRDFVSVESANIVVDKEMLSDENSLGLLVDSIMMSLGADETTQLGALLNANRAFNDIYENIPSDLRFKMQDLLLGNVVSAATIKEIISEFYSIPTVKGLISSLSEQGKAPKGLAGLNTALNIFQLGEVAAGNIESFRGLFEVENDGKTNGFFFLLAQMPIIGDLSSWMERVGIYVDGKSSVRSFNEFKGKDGALDSYQATGSEMLNSGLDPVLKEYLEFFFGTLQNADGSVTSTLRNIMKNPFMIFNYGASLARIKKDGRLMLENAIVEKAESIMEKAREAKAMPEGAKKAAALTEVRADLAEFNTRLNTKFTFATLLEDSGSLKRAIQTHVHDKSYGTDKEAPSTIGTLFGDALAGAIENSMGELAPVRDLVNEVFLHQWRMYDTALTKGIERLEAKGEVSQAEADALIAQLAPLLPHYHGYTGSKGVSSASRIPIFKTEAVVTKDSKVQIKFQGGALGTQKSIQAQALRTKIIDGGVSGFSIAVHTQDAVVMAMLYEANHQLQGRHDAQAVGALDRVTGAQTANKITAEVMSKYSMLHDFVRSGIESLEFAISRGAEVSPESVLLMASKLAELKPLVESIHAKRVELFDNKSVTIDQYPTLLGEGAYTGNMLIQPQPITGFQQVSDAIKSSIAEILKNPPNSLVDFLNGPLLANEASTARAIWAYNKERGITDQPTSAGAVLLDTARRMHEDPNYAQQMADVSPTLRVEFTSSWDTAMSLAGKTMLKGKRIQSADEAKVHSGLMNALRPSPTSATELGLAVTATEETSAEPNEQAIVGADSHIYASLMDESANWLRKSFGSFIGKNKDLVTDPLLLDKSVDLPTRIIAFINGYGSPDSKALYEAFATSQTRVDALNAAIVKANEIAEIVGTESAANATKFSFVPDNAAERVDPVKLAEGADAQVISADSVQTILDTLLSDDLVEVSAETKTVYKALVDKLIGPALGPVTEISLRVKEGIEGIKGTFGALTSAGISIVSGRPNTLNTQSKAEVYLHELTHRFTVEALMKSPVALTALSGLFEQARKALDYTVFLNKDSDGNVVFLTSEDAEIAHAKSMFDYVFNNATRLAGDKGETISVGLLEFVAYALTSPALMSALKDLRVNPTPDSGIKFLDNRAESSLLTKMFNWVYSAFAALTDWMTDSPKGKDVHQRLFNLVMDLNGLQDKHVKANQRSISDKLGSGMDTVNNGVKRYVDGVISALQTKKVANTDLDVLRQTLKIQLVQFGAKLQGMSQADIDKLIEVVDESDDPVKALNALSSKYSILKDEGFVNSIKDTLTGKLSNTAPNIQRTLNRAVSSADRQRETTRSGVTATTKGSFLQRLTATESETMTTALLTSDMVVLVDRYGYEKAGRLMRDNKYLHEEISRLEQSIKSNNPKFAAGMIQQAKGIANVLVKGTGAREMQVSNVGLIVKGAPWPSLKGFEASHNDAVQLHKDLDAYASMQTLAVTTQSSRALASKVWDREFAANSEANGITAAVELHRGAKAAALKQIFDNDPTNVVKGYTPQLFDKNIEWQQANPIRGAELEKLGWKKAFDIDTKIEGGALGMYIRKSNGGSTLMKGAFGLESQQSRGTGIEDAYAESMGGYSGVAVGEIKNRAKRVYEALALRQMGSTYSVGERKNPIGMYNSAGQVVNFSHIMAESTKRELLGKRAMLEEVMGDFAARTVGKRNSEAVNAEVVVALQEDFETNYTKDPESFMWVTSEEWAADGTQNEYFNQFRMLSFDVKKQARELWGDRGIPVRKGFGRVIFGGRKYSIANSKLVNILSDRFPNVPFGGIREIIANLELVWQEVIKIAKVGIVIKTPAVVIMNIVSNMMVLAVNRIDPITASRDAVTGIRELRKYEKLNKEYSVLQLQLRGATTEVGAKRIAIELTRIKSILDSSPIRPLLEEGMFQSIVEDVETSKFGYLDKMTGWLTSKAEDSFGSKAVDIATWLPNQIMMGSDTSVFKFMNKVTQYSDFVARYSYVKQMSARKNAKPMAEIYNGAIENFINYNTPDHAGLQWMNDMGIVMFTKYWLGIQHVITKMFKNQPTEALLSVMGQFALLDIADVMDDSLVNKGVTQVFKSPTDSLDAATKMYGLEFWKNLIPFTN